LEKMDIITESTRQHPRYPLPLIVNFEVGASLTLQASHQKEEEGIGQNISEGGLCLITDRALEESQVIKIRLPIPNVSATIPTLAEVRWVKRQSVQRPPVAGWPWGSPQAAIRQAIARPRGDDQYVVGLRFLF
jgi:PilZ domain